MTATEAPCPSCGRRILECCLLETMCCGCSMVEDREEAFYFVPVSGARKHFWRLTHWGGIDDTEMLAPSGVVRLRSLGREASRRLASLEDFHWLAQVMMGTPAWRGREGKVEAWATSTQ